MEKVRLKRYYYNLLINRMDGIREYTPLFQETGAVRRPITEQETPQLRYQNTLRLCERLQELSELLHRGEATFADFQTFLSGLNSAHIAIFKSFGCDFVESAKRYFNKSSINGYALMGAYMYDLQWYIENGLPSEGSCVLINSYKYPDSIVVGASIIDETPSYGFSFEVPKDNRQEGDDSVYRDEVNWTQSRASGELRNIISRITKEYPDTENPDFDRDKWDSVEEAYQQGGFDFFMGREGTTVSIGGKRVETDRGRFDSPPKEPELIPGRGSYEYQVKENVSLSIEHPLIDYQSQ